MIYLKLNVYIVRHLNKVFVVANILVRTSASYGLNICKNLSVSFLFDTVMTEKPRCLLCFTCDVFNFFNSP